ncbi:hypothetical protein NQ318_014795 [Aromia moschata]|uniref:Uncharacterized protein n=1 Tax=Aromia moschata TaxID=1265417 RepID=A0AAV8ZB99_9CUCU|nr:hypothetical protein NQ318_014795 [Aromia moschata]
MTAAISLIISPTCPGIWRSSYIRKIIRSSEITRVSRLLHEGLRQQFIEELTRLLRKISHHFKLRHIKIVVKARYALSKSGKRTQMAILPRWEKSQLYSLFINTLYPKTI